MLAKIIYIGVLTLLASCFNELFHATLGKTASAYDPENNWYCKHSLNKSNNKITQLPRQYSSSKVKSLAYLQVCASPPSGATSFLASGCGADAMG